MGALISSDGAGGNSIWVVLAGGILLPVALGLTLRLRDRRVRSRRVDLLGRGDTHARSRIRSVQPAWVRTSVERFNGRRAPMRLAIAMLVGIVAGAACLAFGAPFAYGFAGGVLVMGAIDRADRAKDFDRI